jgi:hypothetical protein
MKAKNSRTIMMINLTPLASLRKVLFAAAAVCLLTQCTQEDELVGPVTSDEEISVEGNMETNISSITITGLNTTMSEENLDCTTCTYVVAKNAEIVDGAALGLKAGSVICLDKALQYENVEFVNLEGTEENPIVIGNTSFPASK